MPPNDPNQPVSPPASPQPMPETLPLASPEQAAVPQPPFQTPAPPQPAPITPQAPPQTPPVFTQPTPPVQPFGQPPVAKSKKPLAIGGIIGAVIAVLLGGGSLFYTYVYVPQLTKVSMSDLTSTTTDSIAFRYPKQWKKIDSSTYGDKLGKNDTNSALVSVKKQTYIKSGVLAASDSEVQQIRDTILSGASDSELKSSLVDPSTCSDLGNFTKSSYTHKSDHAVGLVKITAECTKSDTKFKLAFVIILGEDGYLREGFVGASLDNWKQNQPVYDAMLDSVDQVS